MKIKNETATCILNMLAQPAVSGQLEYAVMEDGQFVEADGCDYTGGHSILDQIEEIEAPQGAPIHLSIEIEGETGVVSIPQADGEADVTTVLYTNDVQPSPIQHIKRYSLSEVSIDTQVLPEFFILNGDGNAVSMRIITSQELDLPSSHVREDDESEFAQFALDLLGESEEIQLLLIEHISPSGDMFKSLISRSRAPEKTQKVFGYHGLQEKRRFEVA